MLLLLLFVVVLLFRFVVVVVYYFAVAVVFVLFDGFDGLDVAVVFGPSWQSEGESSRVKRDGIWLYETRET